METISQAPKMSIVQEQKAQVDRLLAQRVQEIMDRGTPQGEALRELYEEVKGKEFRQEQALAKMLYREELQASLDVVNHEIGVVYPSLAKTLHTETVSTHDDKFLVAA